jgi:hypothetical protein
LEPVALVIEAYTPFHLHEDSTGDEVRPTPAQLTNLKNVRESA